jgi:hypothetical protein
MAIFKRKPAGAPGPVGRGNSTLQEAEPEPCVCGEPVHLGGPRDRHWDTHLVQVRSTAGNPALAFDCPLCGPSEMAWGDPGELEISRRNRAVGGFLRHCDEAHGRALR